MKKKVLWAILDLIFLILFNIIFFVTLGTEHSFVVWFSYGFIHFAYLLLLLSTFMIKPGKESYVFGLSIFTVTGLYFIIELILGSIIIMSNPSSYKGPILAQVILCGIFLLFLVGTLIANEHTAESLEKHVVESFYIKNEANNIRGLINMTDNKDIKDKLEHIYDLMYSSPMKSSISVKQNESAISKLIDDLRQRINSGDNDVNSIINQIEQNIIERNNKLKLV